MDSGNEVIIVDDSIATTNGINGNHEDVSDMKTRSKAGEDDLSKPKLRSTRNTTAGTDKVGSDSEKKDGKKASEVIGKKEVDGKANSKDAVAAGAIVSSARSLPQDAKVVASVVVRKTKTGEEEKAAAAAAVPTPATVSKKKGVDREDDSGINSRASSVSNEDATPARMRTRSSRTSEIASTSTPAYKKGQGRMPLSAYDFDDVTFDEDLTSSPSGGPLKRKAVLCVEEMDELDDEDVGEPLEKRPAVAQRSNFIRALLYPLRSIPSIPWKLPGGRWRAAENAELAANAVDSDTVTAATVPAATDAPKLDVQDVGKENIECAVENADEASESANAPSTCRIM